MTKKTLMMRYYDEIINRKITFKIINHFKLVSYLAVQNCNAEEKSFFQEVGDWEDVDEDNNPKDMTIQQAIEAIFSPAGDFAGNFIISLLQLIVLVRLLVMSVDSRVFIVSFGLLVTK